jgi:predicted transcriptional regulator
MLSKCDKYMQRKKDPSELSEKLKRFFEETGIQKAWFARKIGIPHQTMYQVLLGTHKLPERCWKKLVEATGNRITFSDLLKEKYKENPYIQVIATESPDECLLKLLKVKIK